MRGVLRCCGPAAVALVIVLAVSTHHVSAQKTDTASLDLAVGKAVRDVINHGADLFNRYDDYAGCYHAYRAGLIAVRPFLAHRPDLQQTIDDGLAGAEEKSRVAARAFVLRRVLGEVQRQVETAQADAKKRQVEPKNTEEKKVAKKEKPVAPGKVEEKKAAQAEKVEKKEAVAPVRKMARLSGKVTYKGQPVSAGWYVTVVSATDKYVFTTYVRADGTYSFQTPLPAGTYTVAIEEGPRKEGNPPAGRSAVPQRYQNPVTSGLTVDIKSGRNLHDLNLQ